MTNASDNTINNRCENEVCEKDSDCLLNICYTNPDTNKKTCGAIAYRLKLEGYLVYYEIGSWSVAGVLVLSIVGIIACQKYKQGKKNNEEENQEEDNNNSKDQ